MNNFDYSYFVGETQQCTAKIHHSLAKIQNKQLWWLKKHVCLPHNKIPASGSKAACLWNIERHYHRKHDVYEEDYVDEDISKIHNSIIDGLPELEAIDEDITKLGGTFNLDDHMERWGAEIYTELPGVCSSCKKENVSHTCTEQGCSVTICNMCYDWYGSKNDGGKCWNHLEAKVRDDLFKKHDIFEPTILNKEFQTLDEDSREDEYEPALEGIYDEDADDPVISNTVSVDNHNRRKRISDKQEMSDEEISNIFEDNSKKNKHTSNILEDVSNISNSSENEEPVFSDHPSDDEVVDNTMPSMETVIRMTKKDKRMTNKEGTMTKKDKTKKKKDSLSIDEPRYNMRKRKQNTNYAYVSDREFFSNNYRQVQAKPKKKKKEDFIFYAEVSTTDNQTSS